MSRLGYHFVNSMLSDAPLFFPPIARREQPMKNGIRDTFSIGAWNVTLLRGSKLIEIIVIRSNFATMLTAISTNIWSQVDYPFTFAVSQKKKDSDKYRPYAKCDTTKLET